MEEGKELDWLRLQGQHGERRPTGLTYDMLVPSLLTYWFVPMFDHLR
jgi:hypothetical protein